MAQYDDKKIEMRNSEIGRLLEQIAPSMTTRAWWFLYRSGITTKESFLENLY